MPSTLFTRRATRMLRKEKQAWQFRNRPSRTSSTTRARANAKRRVNASSNTRSNRVQRTAFPPPIRSTSPSRRRHAVIKRENNKSSRLGAPQSRRAHPLSISAETPLFFGDLRLLTYHQL